MGFGIDVACGIANARHLGDHPQCLHRERPVVQRSEQLPTKLAFDYDFADGFLSEEEYSMSPRLKKRAIEPPFTGLATRIGTRFPSFSRKWRLRRGTNSPCISPEALRNSATSRGASSRSSSVSHSAQQAWEQSSFGPQCPPTPTKSVFGGSSHENLSQTNPIDIERTNTNGDEPDERFATTPLLPPLMSDASANTNHVPMPSPLQSPSVAEPNDDPFLEGGMPMDATTSQYAVMPSPPLSTKPSTSSFHRNNLNWSGQHTTTEMIIVDMNDEWADKLGHANFTIYPEPYVPERFDVEACRQLRANWDRARCNYTKHLVRIGEHYGATSKTYKLTEEKWAAIESTWRKNNELTIANTVENSSDAFATLKHTTLGDGSNNIMTKIPSLNDPRGGGKFPQLGDEDIVGPMVQVTAQLHRTPSKKTKLFKFITEKFPVGLGKS